MPVRPLPPNPDLDHLKALNAPSPFEEDSGTKSAAMSNRSPMPADRPMEFMLRTGASGI